MLRLTPFNIRKIAPLGTSKGAKPHPFGGKFPTRIGIDVRWGRRPDQRWLYVGKPNIFVFHALNKRLMLQGAAAKYWEFDRKGQLLYAHCQPGARRLRVQNQNTTLIGIYHHWAAAADPFMGFTAPFWMKKIAGRWVYSPFEHLKMDTHLKPYKLWLAAIMETKAAPKVTTYNFQYNMQPLPEPNFVDEGIHVVDEVQPALTLQENQRVRDLLRQARALRIDGFNDGEI